MNFPILSSLILLPVIGSLFLLFSKDKNLGPILTGLTKDTEKNTPVSKSGLSRLRDGKINVPLSKQTIQLVNSISKQDKNTIGKDLTKYVPKKKRLHLSSLFLIKLTNMLLKLHTNTYS